MINLTGEAMPPLFSLAFSVEIGIIDNINRSEETTENYRAKYFIR